MRRTDLATAVVATVWAYLLISGTGGLIEIRARHVSGYPAPEQIMLYAGIPAAFLAILLTAAVLSRKARWFDNMYPAVTVLGAFLLLPVLLVWGGGV